MIISRQNEQYIIGLHPSNTVIHAEAKEEILEIITHEIIKADASQIKIEVYLGKRSPHPGGIDNFNLAFELNLAKEQFELFFDENLRQEIPT
jgi:hypothetical protein